MKTEFLKSGFIKVQSARQKTICLISWRYQNGKKESQEKSNKKEGNKEKDKEEKIEIYEFQTTLKPHTYPNYPDSYPAAYKLSF